jgi:hypothetical protein
VGDSVAINSSNTRLARTPSPSPLLLSIKGFPAQKFCTVVKSRFIRVSYISNQNWGFLLWKRYPYNCYPDHEEANDGD